MLKTTIHISTLTFFILFGSLLNAQSFKFSGKIFAKNDELKNATIEVYEQENLITTESTNASGKFKFQLEEGKVYILKVSKEKFVPKTILISALAGNEEGKQHFQFDIELENERNFRYVNDFDEEKPVAHIYYNENNEGFDWDRELSEKRLNEIEEVKKLNKEKRYEMYSKF